MSVRWEPIDERHRRASRLMLAACVSSAVLAALAFPFDRALSRLAVPFEPERAPLVTLFRAVQSFGKADVLCAALLLACLTRLRRPAVRGLVALALVALPTVLLKESIGRERPSHHSDSFPSGDTASVVATLAPLCLASPALRIPLAALALAVALFRVVANDHYPSDVLAGAALGFLGAWAALRRVPASWLRPRSRRIVPLLLGAVASCVVVAIVSERDPPSRTFLYYLLPLLLLAVLLERRRLARLSEGRLRAAERSEER